MSTLTRIKGKKKVVAALTYINDLARIDKAISGGKFLDEVVSLPQVVAPISKRMLAIPGGGLGRLTLIDNPGMDDNNLDPIVESQLEKVNLILLVLDYTKLDNASARTLKERVLKIAEIRGKEMVYVFVNKVDQRSEKNDMDTEATKRFVNIDLGLDFPEGEEHVFEGSALHAFVADRFLGESNKMEGKDLSTVSSARMLAETAFAGKWEKKLARNNLDILVFVFQVATDARDQSTSTYCDENII